ncbi:hypothetical protein [Flavobacterium sp. ASW18X]|uniref:hypothetical protein n=1 Tax=Flavobacterium sp. ASW18X TaxID=2572595 RepID=UPI001F0CECC3|nr:hypothetical protein [Flavobacterium sp. ASW18X]
MKTIKNLFALCFLTLLSTSVTQAQFLKNLGKKAQKAAERTVERRVERETSKKTDQTIDSVFTKKEDKGIEMGEDANKAYAFNTKYVMEITTDNDVLPITYFFSEKGDVMATTMEIKPNEKIYSIIDLGENKIHSLMDLNGQRSRTSMKFSPNKIMEDTDYSKISVKPNGQTKTIIEYTCKGYEVSGTDFNGTVWVAENTGFSYPEKFKNMSIKNGKKEGINPQWMSLVEGIPLEMDMLDSSKKKPQKVHMLCTEIGTTTFSLDPTEYKGIF